jgi:hypothetical protein
MLLTSFQFSCRSSCRVIRGMIAVGIGFNRSSIRFLFMFPFLSADQFQTPSISSLHCFLLPATSSLAASYDSFPWGGSAQGFRACRSAIFLPQKILKNCFAIIPN